MTVHPPHKVSIIIPAYNEASIIGKLLLRVAAADTSPFAAEIIVVDDGSTDDTFTIVEEVGREIPALRCIRLGENRGKLFALQQGFAMASGEIILVQDADMEYSPEDYSRILEPFTRPDVMVVFGSRFMKTKWPENMLLAYWLANRLFTLLVNLLFHAGITDEGTAYKAFRKSLLHTVTFQSSGFSFCAEITCKLASRQIAIHEVPISYYARSKHEGKKPRFIDGVKIITTIFGLKIRSMRGEKF